MIAAHFHVEINVDHRLVSLLLLVMCQCIIGYDAAIYDAPTNF